MNMLAVLMTAFLLGGGDPAKTDLDKLQGTWVLVSMQTEGHDVAAEDFKVGLTVSEQNRVTVSGLRLQEAQDLRRSAQNRRQERVIPRSG